MSESRKTRFNRVVALFTVYCMVGSNLAWAVPIVIDGNTQTSLNVNGHVTDITTSTIKGSNAFNSFTKFNVNQNKMVNLHVPNAANNLVNLVHGAPSQINGILNSYKNGQIGGNVFFANPHGMVVGSQGVVNVGSLTAVTPTHDFMSNFFSSPGNPSSLSTQQLLSGSMPLNQDGSISVQGKINAQNGIKLLAGNVNVAAGSHLVNMISSAPVLPVLSDIVNTEGLSSATQMVEKNGEIYLFAAQDVQIAGDIKSEGIEGIGGGDITVKAANDIIIADNATISVKGNGANSDGGNIIVFADNDSTLGNGAVLDASAGSTGDGGFVELSAINTVNINGGDLKASSASGAGGAILIDPEELLWTGSGNDMFQDGVTFGIEATKRIVLDDVYLSSRKVAVGDNNRANILTAASIGNSGDITIDAPIIELKNGTTILANADNNFTGGKVSLTAHDEAVLPTLGFVTATSEITIDEATIKANEVFIDAKSNIDSQFVYSSDDPVGSAVNIATATAQQVGGFLATLGGANLVVSDVDANATVNINKDANIEATNSVTISAENVTKSGMAKRPPSPGAQFDTPVGIGALWVSDKSDATVTVGEGATIKAADLNILAHNNARLEGSIASGQNQTANSNFTAIAASITKADVQANATVESGATLQVSGDLKVSATNVGSYVNSVTAKTGPNGRAAAAIAYADHQSGVTASLNANVGDATKVEVVAINAVLKDQATAISKVGGTAFDAIIAQGEEKVKALGNAESEFWGKLGLQALTPKNKASPTQQKFRIGGAIAYNKSTHNALAEIGDSSSIHATESTAVISRVLAKGMKVAAQAAAISTAASKPAAFDTARQAYSVGLAIGDFAHDAVSRVGVDAAITAPKIAVYSDTVIPIRDSLLFGSETETDKWDRWSGLDTISKAIGTVTNVFDVFNGSASARSTSDGSDGSINLSGSVGILNYSDNSRAIIEKGAELNISGNEKGAWDTTFIVQPEIELYDQTGTVLLSTTPAVIETFSFEAAATVQAKRDATLLFLAGRLPSANGEKGLGVSFNQVSVNSVTEAIVREGAIIQGIDELASGAVLGSRTWSITDTQATEELNVSAVNNERIWNLAAGGGFGGSYGANGNYTQMNLDSSVHALVDDEVEIKAKKLSVVATASPVLWSIAGTVIQSENVAVGIGVAINDVETSVRAEIADNDNWSVDEDPRSSLVTKVGTTIYSPEVNVSAKTSGHIEAVAVTGSVSNNVGDPPGSPGPGDKIKAALGITKLTAQAGNLVSLQKSNVQTSNSSQQSQQKNKKPPSSQSGISGAGSGSINVIEMATSARVEGVTIDQTDSAGHSLEHSLLVRSVSDSDLVAVAGAAAITRANNFGLTGAGPAQTKPAAIAGSVAINSLGNSNEAWIKNATVLSANDVTLQALSGGEQLAIGLGVAIDATKNASVESSKAFAGSVSITETHTDDNGDSKNKTVAKMDNANIVGEAAVSDRNIEVTAYNRSYIGTGAGSLAVQVFGGKAKGTSVGGAVSWANIRNDVISGIYNGSNINAVDTVDVKAYNATEIGAGAAMGSFSGAEGVNSISASMVANQITNNTTAAIDHSVVNATDSVNVIAADQGADSNLETIIDPDGERNNTVAGLDYCGASAGSSSPGGNCITAVAGTVQAGRGNNVGFSISYNSIVNNLTARVKDSVINVTGTASSNAITVSADSNTAIFGMAFGVGASVKKLSAAGSISIAEITNNVLAEVGESVTGGVETVLTAPTVSITSNDEADITTIAGQVNVSVKDKALGTAVAYNSINNETRAIVDTATITAGSSIEITSTERAEIESVSAAAGLSQGRAAALSLSLNFVDNMNKAEVTDATLEAGGTGTNTVSVKAKDTSKISSLAGSIAGGTAAKAGAGAAFSLNQIANTNYAGVISSTIDGASTFDLIAHEEATIRTLAAAVGAGENGFSGSLSLNNIGHNFLGSHPNTTIAELKDSTISNGNGSVVTVKGWDESTIESIAGAVALGSKGAVGGAIADNNIQTTAKGSVSGSVINNTNSLVIRGENKATIKSASVSGSVSSGDTFAGSASSNRTENKTYGELINSEVTGSSADVDVQADNDSEIEALAGGVAVSFSAAAVGIAIAVNQIDDTTSARVSGKKAPTSQHQVKNLTVDAVSETTIRALSLGAAASSTKGGAGSIAVNLIDSDTLAYIDDSANILAQNNVGVTAESDDKITIASGGASLSAGAAGIGVSFTFNYIGSTTDAYISGSNTRVTGLALNSADSLSVYSGQLETGVDLSKQIDITSFDTLNLKDDKEKVDINGVAVNASSSQSIENISATLGVSTGVTVAAAASVNTIGGSTSAYVINSQINQDNKVGAGSAQKVEISASNIAYGNSLVGGLTVGASAGGLSVDTLVMQRTTRAIAQNAVINAKNDVSVKARAIQGVSSLAIGGALGGDAGSGTLSLALFNNTTEATVDGSRITASDLDISANNRNEVTVKAGQVSLAGNGAVGAAIAVTSSDSTTTATLKNATGVNRVDASGAVRVDATNTTDIDHIVVSGSGGGSFGVAGMADVNLITDKTEAKVIDSDIGTNSDKVASAHVEATHELNIDGKAGALGVGLTGAGVGAGASVNIIKAKTIASVTDSNIYANGLTEVTATSIKKVDSTALTAGIGLLAGIGGAAIVTLIGDDVKDESASEVNKGGSGTLSFVDEFTTSDKLELLPGNDTSDGSPEILSSAKRDEIRNASATSTTDVTGSAGGYEFRTAAEVSGNNTITAGSFNAIATDKTDTKSLVGGLGASLGGGVGGAVAVTTVKANVAAIVSGTALTTNGDITIQATADKDDGKTADVLAIAGGIGSVGLGAAVSYIDISNNVDAKLLSDANAGTGSVTVLAEDKMDIESDAKGAAIGGYAAGIVVSVVEKDSTITATAGNTITAAGVTVKATDEGDVIALGQSAAAGLIGGVTGTVVNATDGSIVKAQTLSNTTFNLGTGSLNVIASATPRVEAEADGVAVSGGISIGASISDALADTNIQAVLGNNTTVNAGGLTLSAKQLRNGSHASAKAESFAASGGLLFGGSATTSDADSTLVVESTVGDDSTLNIGSGTVTIEASIDSSQSSKASGVNGGIVAAGYNDASATSTNVITSSLGNNVKVVAGTLEIKSGGTDTNLATAKAGAGGLLVGSASSAKTNSDNNTVASIGSGSASRNIVVDDFSLKADHKTTFNSKVDSSIGSVIGKSGASAINTSTSDVKASIGQGINISAQSVDIDAINRTRKSTNGAVDIVSASGGLLDSAAAYSKSTVNNDTDVTIASNVLIETRATGPLGHFNINAENDVALYDTTKMDSGGAIAISRAVSLIYSEQNDADITIDQGTILNSADDMLIEAKTAAIADTYVIDKTYGLAGTAEGKTVSSIKTSNNVSLNGARLESDENITVRAGYNNVLKSDAETRLYNRTAIPVEIDPDADATIIQDNKITIASYVPGVGTVPTGATSDEQIQRAAVAAIKDIHLESGDGKHTTRGYGRGTDLYREFIAGAAELFGADISLDITAGSTTDKSESGVIVDGTVFAGKHYQQILHINADGDITQQSEGMASPTYRYNVDLARDISTRINALQALYDEYKDDNPDIANGFRADIDILEAKASRLGVGASADFIDIGPVAAYTGSIFTTGDSLAGNGELIAPGDARIEIINDSNAFINIGRFTGDTPTLYIPDDLAGIVTLNGVRVSTKAEIDDINQRSVESGFTAGKILDRNATVEPVILVSNTYEDAIDLDALNPEIRVDGDISNLRGLVKLSSTGTIQVASKIYGKTIDIKTKGDFIQTFTVGFTHTGGDPTYNIANGKAGEPSEVNRDIRNRFTGALEEDQLVPYTLDFYYEDLAKQEHPESSYFAFFNSLLPFEGDVSKSYAEQVVLETASSTIAGNNVFISGERLNINSLIQSGLPDFDLAISQTQANAAIGANGDWVDLGMTENGELVDPLFQPKIRWKEDQIELQSLAVGGGYMQLYGDIFSTGNGKLKVLDGYGRINVKNDSSYNLAVNRLDTGPGVAGTIKITDTSTKDSLGNALITTITRSGGNVVASYENRNGSDSRSPSVTNQSVRTAKYDPRSGRRLHWFNAERKSFERYEISEQSCFIDCDSLGIGDAFSADAGTVTKGPIKTVTSNPRPYGEWLQDDSRTDAYILDFERSRSTLDDDGGEVTRTYRSGIAGANLNIVSKRTWEWTEDYYFDHSLYASVPIDIEFTGYDTGLLTVDAGAHNLSLNGAIRNLTNTTTLTANNINATSTVVINALDLNLIATAGSIGTAALNNIDSSYLKTNLTGTLDAQATDGIAVWQQYDALTIKSAEAGGIVNIKADGDLLYQSDDVIVKGGSIRLTSENGSVGTVDAALKVDVTASTGNLGAFSAKDVALVEVDGDLRIDSITSRSGAGNVMLTVFNGNIIDDNSVSIVDVETRAELLEAADRAGLRGAGAVISEEATVSSYNIAKQQEYITYWQLRNVKTDQAGNFVAADSYDAGYSYKVSAADITDLKTNRGWTDQNITQLEKRQTEQYHASNTEFGAQAYNGDFRYDVEQQDNTIYQQMITGSTWSDSQITNSIAAGIFKDTADTEVLIEEANVTGRNITLTSANGGIGIEKSIRTISLADPDSWTDDERIALTAADRSDVTIDYDNKTISVRQKDDIDITMLNGGQLVATAGSNIYLGSEADVLVKQVVVPFTKEVRIKTGASLINAALAGTAAITASDVLLEAGGNDLATSDNPFTVHTVGNLTARARNNLFINNTAGDLRINQVFAGNLAQLISVGGIFEDSFSYDLITDIQANKISLTAATDIGEFDPLGLKYLDIASGPTGWVDLTASGLANIYSPSTQINLRNVTVGNGEFNLTSFASSLNVVGTISAKTGVNLNAAEAVLLGADSLIEATEGSIEIKSSGFKLATSSDPFAAEDTTQYGLKMDAGSSLQAKQDIKINTVKTIAMADDAWINADLGNIDIQTQDDAILTGVSAVNAGGARINIQSGGRLIDAGDKRIDITAKAAGSIVTLNAAVDVGNGTWTGTNISNEPNPIEIHVAYAEIKTPVHSVVIGSQKDKLDPSATVQLDTRNRPINIRLTDEPLIYTNADVINYNPDYIVNGFSTENSLVRLATKRNAAVMSSNEAMRKGEFKANPNFKSLQNRGRALGIGSLEDTLQYDQLNISKRSDEEENDDEGVSIVPAF